MTAMPASDSLELSPPALVARFGRRSVLAKLALQQLAAEGTPLPSIELPSSEPQLARIERSPAFQRWQRELELSQVSAQKLIAATQVYTLLVIQWLGEVLIDHLKCQSASGDDSPFVPTSIARFAADPPAAFASCAQDCRSAMAAFSISPSSLGKDYFKTFYQQLLPREVRHALGEYYTPDWLAEYLMQLVGERAKDGRIIDPACGSGTFLLHALRKQRQTLSVCQEDRATQLSRLLHSVVGIDVHPLAVAAARLNYALAIVDLLHPGAPLPELPVYQADSILLEKSLAEKLGRFELVIGNPPWVGWETLPAEYRVKTRDLWLTHGLFPHRGMSAILGSGKKDLSMLLSYVASDQLLKEGGWLAFITTQAVFKTSAGAGFRRFQLGPDETPLGVTHVEDLTEVQPFPGATNRTVLFLWQKGKITRYPLPYFVWQPVSGGSPRLPEAAPLDEVLKLVTRQVCAAEPAAPNQPTSTWLTLPAADCDELRKLVGPSPYRAHEGANTGGANAVYWLKKTSTDTASNFVQVQNIVAGAKRAVSEVSAELEPDLLYPLLRGSDVRRWRAEPTAWLLLAQDPIQRSGIGEVELQKTLPRTYAYLKQFETMLRGRAAYKRYFERRRANSMVAAPFYSMFDVGSYTLAPCKVVWHRMLTPVQAAVVDSLAERPIIPQETLAFIPCSTATEAHYLCGLLNSAIFNRAAAAYSQAGGKSFASPHLLTHLHLPQFDEKNAHQCQLAQEAQRLAANAAASLDRRSSLPAQTELDQLAKEVWLSAEI